MAAVELNQLAIALHTSNYELLCSVDPLTAAYDSTIEVALLGHSDKRFCYWAWQHLPNIETTAWAVLEGTYPFEVTDQEYQNIINLLLTECPGQMELRYFQ